MSGGVTTILVDARPAAERGGVGLALDLEAAVVHATDGVQAGRLAAGESASIAVVHAGHDAGSDRPPGGVLAAAELARHRKGISILLVGQLDDLSGWLLLHRFGATARFVPDSIPQVHATRLLALLREEAAAKRALSQTLQSIPRARPRRLESTWLTAFANDVEESLIRVTCPWASKPSTHARLLGLRDSAFRSKVRKLSLPLPTSPPPRSKRDRILVVGTGPASVAFADILAAGEEAVAVVRPGGLHVEAEARAGARAALVQVDTLGGVADAWALQSVAPLVPMILHGTGAAPALSFLRALRGLSDPLSCDALAAKIAEVSTRVIELGRVSLAADACCRAAGGMGQSSAQPQPIGLTEVTHRAKRELAAIAVAQEGTLDKAAQLLQVSVRTVQRILDRQRRSLPPT